jgi:hypothetical protein
VYRTPFIDDQTYFWEYIDSTWKELHKISKEDIINN